MANLTPKEKRIIEEVLRMSDGYVLDFSNRTFQEFFWDTFKIDIYDAKYAFNGDSKAKKLRAFLQLESDQVVGKALNELIPMIEYFYPDTKIPTDYFEIVQRLLGNKSPKVKTVDDFLKEDFGNIDLNKIKDIEGSVAQVLESRLKESIICINQYAPLAAIFLLGSILEGILYAIANKNPKIFNQASCAPKKDGKPKTFDEWKLAELIDVAYETKFIRLDVKKFSHELRDFRNYIHPYVQMSSNFAPDKHTAEICLQVLKAAIAGLNKKE